MGELLSALFGAAPPNALTLAGVALFGLAAALTVRKLMGSH